MTCILRLFALAFLVLGCKGDPSAGPGIGPRLVFEAPEYDFGTALAGETVSHVFRFRNAGDEPLIVGALSTSCSGATAIANHRYVAPGESGHVELAFDTSGYDGETRTTVNVASNDSTAARTVLVLAGNVELPLDFEPRYFKLITDDPAYRRQRIWITGRYADRVHLRLNHFESTAAADAIVSVVPFEEELDGKMRVGVEFSLKAKAKHPAPGAAMAVLDTGLPEPSQLAIEVDWAESVKLPR